MSETPKVVKDLLAKLIYNTTGISERNDASNFKICQKFALHKIKNHKFGRPNQFEVARTLGGYIERYSILDNEATGAALASRLDELQNTDFQLAPEVLTLLLTLADRPFDADVLTNLANIPKKTVPKELTWEDIMADDPLEGELWEDIDYGADSDLSMEDDGLMLGEIRPPGLINDTKSTTSTVARRSRVVKKPQEPDMSDMLGCFVVPVDETIPDILDQRQYWTHTTKPIPVPSSISVRLTDNTSIMTELDCVREILIMLGGYESPLFRKTDDNTVEPYFTDPHAVSIDYALQHTGNGSFRALLRQFAEFGTALTALRSFLNQKEALSTRQAFVGALARKLKDMRETLANLQSRFVDNPETTQIVSIMDIQSEIERHIRPYLTLFRILPALNTRAAASSRSAPHLDALYSSACTGQMTGDMESYKFFRELFFSSLNSYLRPIREWMESGELQAEDSAICFINKNEEEVLPSELWEKQYSIITRTTDGVPEAPTFILPFVEKIFTTGKSVIFLKRLINYEVPPVPSVSRIELDMSSISGNSTYLELAPFEQLFSDALSAWVSRKHNSVGSLLRNVLYYDCGLLRCLDALDHIYLMKDGHLMDVLTTTLLDRLRRDREMWNDRFLITELLQSIFHGVPCIDASRLSAKHPRNIRGGTIAKLATINFEYTLPWPIANLLPPSTITAYHTLFTLLLQLTSTISLLSPLLPKNAAGPLPPPLLLLRHKILTFARTLLTYLTSLILLPQSLKLRDALEQVKDVEGMINVHRRYTKRVREMCLLGEKMKPVKKAVVQILSLGCEVAEWYAVACKGVEGGGGIDMERGQHEGIERQRRRERKKRRVGIFRGVDTETEGDTSAMEVEEEEEEEEEEPTKEMDLGGSLERLEGLVGFVRNSLKGVSRAGVMPHFDLLAEEL
ncbi:hypothetical protein BJ508DRAFT_373031 [Ascobolus immersus RN42]|uniref:Spindle pole body component n=1 Tax=Ascobolus immersus RN42 TaxID=1160509 RepID=A0A3N4IJF5_ASCIM|nr:hypothetical protein BJ508DRAFT_373031 [Ascobolus immersus RN42]